LFGGRGLRETDYGAGVDGGDIFDGVREYHNGDELRRVNWRATARFGSLVVSEYRQGITTELIIVLDATSSSYVDGGSGPERSFECAVTIAASLVQAQVDAGRPAELIVCGVDGARMYNVSGIDDLPLVMDALARVNEADDVNIETILAGVVDIAKPGRRMAIITGDLSLRSKAGGVLDMWTARSGVDSVALLAVDNASFRTKSHDFMLSRFAQSSSRQSKKDARADTAFSADAAGCDIVFDSLDSVVNVFAGGRS
jgi:uncharacterized protein (DUF58 family)